MATVAHKGHIDFFRRKLVTCDRNLLINMFGYMEKSVDMRMRVDS